CLAFLPPAMCRTTYTVRPLLARAPVVWQRSTPSGGWRMRRNKPALADLKKLRQEAQSPEAAPQPVTQPKRLARKRSPFLPPSAASPTGGGGGAADGVTTARGAARREAAAGTSPPASAPQAEPVSAQLSESDRK